MYLEGCLSRKSIQLFTGANMNHFCTLTAYIVHACEHHAAFLLCYEQIHAAYPQVGEDTL